MKTRQSILIVLLCFFSLQASAQDLKSFLKACGWGTLGGALVGTVSLAFENKPSDHMNNIARGASLGLYGGILYGLSAKENVPSEDVAKFGLAPDLQNQGLRFAFVTSF